MALALMGTSAFQGSIKVRTLLIFLGPGTEKSHTDVCSGGRWLQFQKSAHVTHRNKEFEA